MEDTNTLITIAIVLAAIEIAAGIAFGWWLRGTRAAESESQSAAAAECTRAALAQLYTLASDVAADVGEHSSRVQAISGGLTATDADGNVGTQMLEAVSEIVKANEQLQQQLVAAKSRLDEQAAEIQEHVAVSKTDALTGIANRRAFDEHLPQRLSEWKRKQTPVSLIMIDVDKFKIFNDTFGHQAGDQVLREVARALVETMREMDVVARFGGEEFAVIVPSTKLHEALPGAERARKAIANRTIIFEGRELKVTASMGVAQALPDEDLSSLVRRADEALYAAKNAGRNCTQYHDGHYMLPAITAPPPPKAPPAEKKLEASTAERLDEFIGLPSRTAFCEDVRRRLAEAHRYGTQLSIVTMKVDRLGEIIQRHGTAAADLALKTVGKFLSAAMRESDFVTYYDPNMFAMLLPSMSCEDGALVAERLRQSIVHSPLQSKELELKFTVSLGVASVLPGYDSSQLLGHAEAAAIGSVEAGGNCIHCFSTDGLKRMTATTLEAAAPATPEAAPLAAATK